MRFKLFSVAASAGILALSVAAQAQTYAANTFLSGQAFYDDTGFTISGSGSVLGTYYSQTETFTAAAGGQVSNVAVAAENVSGTNGIDLSLEDSSSNVLASWSATGLPVFGSNGAATTLTNSDPSVRLTLGDTYELVMTPIANDTWSTWNMQSSSNYVGAYSVQVTPEPAPFAALGLGVLPLIGLRRRSRKA